MYREINEFKRGYRPKSNLVKDKNGDLLADSHNILNRFKNYFSQLLNLHRVGDVRHIDILTAEPSVHDSSPLELEIAITKLKKYKSPGSDEILGELMQAHSLTHGAEPFSRSCQLCSYPRTSQHFMEPISSLPCSQEPFTGPYPQPDHSNPYHPISLTSILILFTHLSLGLRNGLLPSSFPTNIQYVFLLSPIRATCPAHFILLDLIILIITSTPSDLLYSH
jgi:hypothetical protein